MTEVAVQAPARERSILISWTVAISSVALFVATLDNLVVTTALPTLGRHLNASVPSLEWAVTAYALALAVSLLAGAALGNRFGHRRMFLIGLALFTGSSAGCALAPTVELLDAARALQGVGGGLVVALTLTILRDAFPGERQGLAQGLWWAIGGIGVLVGPLVGGVLVTQVKWQWIFWVNVPVGIAAIALAAVGLQPTRGPRTKIDVPGLALVSAALVAIVWGLTRGSDIGWTSKQVIPALGAGALWLAAFVVWELAASRPVLPFRALGQRRYLAVDAVSLLASFGLFGALFVLIQFLQVVQEHSALRTGLATLPLIGGSLLIAPVVGALCPRVGIRPFVALGLALQTAALAWFAHVSSVDVTYLRLLPGFAAFGAGIGLFLPAVASGVLDSVRSEAAEHASGANNAVGAAGGAAGVAGLMAVLLTSGSYASGAAFTDGLVRALWVAAAVVAGATLVSLVIPGRRRVPEVVATVLDARAPAAGSVAVARVETDAESELLPDVQAGDEAEPDAYTCPVCLGHGSFAFHPPVDPRTEMCPRCYGHGQVLTGSHVPAHIVRDCPECEGCGYVETPAPVEPPQVRRAVQAQAPVGIDGAPDPGVRNGAPEPEVTSGPLAEFARRTTSGWEELRGRPRPTT